MSPSGFGYGYNMCRHLLVLEYLVRVNSAWGWTNQSMPQPVPSPDKRGGLASGASRL